MGPLRRHQNAALKRINLESWLEVSIAIKRKGKDVVVVVALCAARELRTCAKEVGYLPPFVNHLLIIE